MQTDRQCQGRPQLQLFSSVSFASVFWALKTHLPSGSWLHFQTFFFSLNKENPQAMLFFTLCYWGQVNSLSKSTGEVFLISFLELQIKYAWIFAYHSLILSMKSMKKIFTEAVFCHFFFFLSLMVWSASALPALFLCPSIGILDSTITWHHLVMAAMSVFFITQWDLYLFS